MGEAHRGDSVGAEMVAAARRFDQSPGMQAEDQGFHSAGCMRALPAYALPHRWREAISNRCHAQVSLIRPRHPVSAERLPIVWCDETNGGHRPSTRADDFRAGPSSRPPDPAEPASRCECPLLTPWPCRPLPRPPAPWPTHYGVTIEGPHRTHLFPDRGPCPSSGRKTTSPVLPSLSVPDRWLGGHGEM